ncbi:uncharacterized protein BKA78DRAFT_62011 [Phyllosticta capitalensis]|uniref:uncharacterized protein n=1 Tax=Phyllosticta capitalensis TaxID=121624 RepID=UPI00312DFC0F
MTEPSPQSTIKPEQSHQSRVAVAVGSRQPPRPRPRIWRGGPWMPVCVRVCAMSLPVSRERDAQIGRMTNRVGCACGRSAPGTAKNRETTGSFAEALVPAATHGGLPCGCVGVGLLASDLARNAGPGTTASPSRPRALCDDAEKHREATITNPHLSHTRDGH